MTSSSSSAPISDSNLVATLPGFASNYAEVNDVLLHYVEGGKGDPLFLLPGWPQTWWQFSRVLQPLAERYRVVAVDLRGMGGSAKPASGYDKKTMAADILALARHLGFESINIAGNDIGAMVAYSFAANHPEATRKVVMMDSPHPFSALEQIPILPPCGAYDLDNPNRAVHPWWFAFNQIPGLQEAAFEGRYWILQDWVFDYLGVNRKAITAHDRAVYAAAYNSTDALRAVHGWFASFSTDISDAATYDALGVPALALGGICFDFVAAFLQTAAPTAKLVRLPDTGHWIPDEQPEEVVRQLFEFIG